MKKITIGLSILLTALFSLQVSAKKAEVKTSVKSAKEVAAEVRAEETATSYKDSKTTMYRAAETGVNAGKRIYVKTKSEALKVLNRMNPGPLVNKMVTLLRKPKQFSLEAPQTNNLISAVSYAKGLTTQAGRSIVKKAELSLGLVEVKIVEEDLIPCN